MPSMKYRWLLLFVPLLLSACGGGDGPPIPATRPTAKAAGVFLVDGQAPEKADPPHVHIGLYLLPKDAPATAEQGIPAATVGPGGKYELSTFSEGDGVPEGEYVICFESLTPTFGNYKIGPDKFLNNFSNPLRQAQKPEFVVKVEKGKPITLPKIDIKMAELEAQPPNKWTTPDTANASRNR